MDGDGRIWHKNECSSGLEIFFEFRCVFVLPSIVHIMSLGEVDGTVSGEKNYRENKV